MNKKNTNINDTLSTSNKAPTSSITLTKTNSNSHTQQKKFNLNIKDDESINLDGDEKTHEEDECLIVESKTFSNHVKTSHSFTTKKTAQQMPTTDVFAEQNIKIAKELEKWREIARNREIRTQELEEENFKLRNYLTTVEESAIQFRELYNEAFEKYETQLNENNELQKMFEICRCHLNTTNSNSNNNNNDEDIIDYESTLMELEKLANSTLKIKYIANKFEPINKMMIRLNSNCNNLKKILDESCKANKSNIISDNSIMNQIEETYIAASPCVVRRNSQANKTCSKRRTSSLKQRRSSSLFSASLSENNASLNDDDSLCLVTKTLSPNTIKLFASNSKTVTQTSFINKELNVEELNESVEEVNETSVTISSQDDVILEMIDENGRLCVINEKDEDEYEEENENTQVNYENDPLNDGVELMECEPFKNQLVELIEETQLEEKYDVAEDCQEKKIKNKKDKPKTTEPLKESNFQLNNTKKPNKEIELEKQHSRPSITHSENEIPISSKNKRKSSLLNGDPSRDRRRSKAFRLSTDENPEDVINHYETEQQNISKTIVPIEVENIQHQQKNPDIIQSNPIEISHPQQNGNSETQKSPIEMTLETNSPPKTATSSAKQNSIFKTKQNQHTPTEVTTNLTSISIIPTAQLSKSRQSKEKPIEKEISEKAKIQQNDVNNYLNEICEQAAAADAVQNKKLTNDVHKKVLNEKPPIPGSSRPPKPPSNNKNKEPSKKITQSVENELSDKTNVVTDVTSSARKKALLRPARSASSILVSDTSLNDKENNSFTSLSECNSMSNSMIKDSQKNILDQPLSENSRRSRKLVCYKEISLQQKMRCDKNNTVYIKPRLSNQNDAIQ